MESAAPEKERAPDAPRRQWRGTGLTWLIVVVVIFAGRFSPYKPVSNFFGGFGWLTAQAVRLTRELFESYGELTVFLAPLLENTIFLGALIPGNLVMLLAGVSARDGLIDLKIAIPLGIVGAIIGDTISYFIGRFGWKRLGPESRLVRWSERMREPLLKHSVWLVLSYHFAGYTRLIGPAASGFIRMPLRRWMVLDYIGVSLWVVVFIMAGYMLGVFGLTLDETSDRNIRIFELILFGLVAIGAVALLRRTGQQRGGPGDDASSTSAPSGEGQADTPVTSPADQPVEESTAERVG